MLALAATVNLEFDVQYTKQRKEIHVIVKLCTVAVRTATKEEWHQEDVSNYGFILIR